MCHVKVEKNRVFPTLVANAQGDEAMRLGGSSQGTWVMSSSNQVALST